MFIAKSCKTFGCWTAIRLRTHYARMHRCCTCCFARGRTHLLLLFEHACTLKQLSPARHSLLPCFFAVNYLTNPFIHEFTHNLVIYSLPWPTTLFQMVALMHSFGISMRWLGDVAKHCLGRTLSSRSTGSDNREVNAPFALASGPDCAKKSRRRSSIYTSGNRKRLSMQSHPNACD